MIEIFVSPQGSDANSGTRAAPLRTIDKARHVARRAAGQGKDRQAVTVSLRAGVYPLSKSVVLTKGDSGTEQGPVVFRAYRGEDVRLTGGREIPPGAFGPVTDKAVLKRLPPAARKAVVKADLKALGNADLGVAVKSGKRPELFFNDQPMTLARWPNEGFVRIPSVLRNRPFDVRGTKGDKVGRFTYRGERPKRWLAENDAWLHGYWFWDWSSSYEKVASIDAERHVIRLAEPYHNYGYRKDQRYYAVNLLAELDTPGEWYLDRETGVLYFWPPAPLDNARVVFSVLETPLFVLKNASHLVLRGLTFEAVRGTAITMTGGNRNRVERCVIRNTGRGGIAIAGGNRHSVRQCEITRTGAHGIILDGGNRKKLTPAHHCAVNNHIHDFGRLQRTYAGAVHIAGVGQRVANNCIHHAPHTAILFTGNEHVMELNEIHDVCSETGDVGVFYTGRDWTMRGNVIRYNFVHHIHGPGDWGAQVIYLDDAASGTTVFGNVIYKGARAMLIGGGRDNIIENNMLIDCEHEAIFLDDRGLNWMAYHVGPGGTMPQRLADMPYRKPPWAGRYPELLTVLDDGPGVPKYNVVRNNVIQRCKAMNIAAAAREYGTIADNLVTNAALGFVDAKKMDFRLKKSSIIYRKLPGFKKIPFDRIGLRGWC